MRSEGREGRRIGWGDYATSDWERLSQAAGAALLGANPGDFTPQAGQFPAI